MPSRKKRVLDSNLSRRAVESDSISRTLSDAAAIGGASELENRYGRERCRSRATISLAPAGVAAAGAAQRLAERAGQDVHAAHDIVVFMRAAPGRAQEADRVGVVHHDQGVIAFGQVADGGQIGDEAVHREHAVGGDQPCARALRFLQLGFQIGHVAVVVAKALGFAQPDAVNDAGMVQFVGDDGVFGAEQRLEQTAVGVEATDRRGWCLRCRETR